MSKAAVYKLSFPVFFLLFSGFIRAQSTGSIGGTVFDAAGSMVPNATFTVRNQATGEEHVTKTDVAGIYLISSLPVGTYRVEVQIAGHADDHRSRPVSNFRSAVRCGRTLF